MKCPNDDAILVMSERAGVEIDYCPDCRGVWLDRGELDKILDRMAAESASPQPKPSSARYEASHQQPHRNDFSSPPRYQKKRGHWLTELFD